MLRVSLDDMVLQILLLDKGDPAEFLASAANPPTDLAVGNSIKYLCELQVRSVKYGTRVPLGGCSRRGSVDSLLHKHIVKTFRFCVVPVEGCVSAGSHDTAVKSRLAYLRPPGHRDRYFHAR